MSQSRPDRNQHLIVPVIPTVGCLLQVVSFTSYLEATMHRRLTRNINLTCVSWPVRVKKHTQAVKKIKPVIINSSALNYCEWYVLRVVQVHCHGAPARGPCPLWRTVPLHYSLVPPNINCWRRGWISVYICMSAYIWGWKGPYIGLYFKMVSPIGIYPKYISWHPHKPISHS